MVSHQGILELKAVNHNYVDLNAVTGNNTLTTTIPIIGGVGYQRSPVVAAGFSIEFTVMAQSQIHSAPLFSCSAGLNGTDGIVIAWDQSTSSIGMTIHNSETQQQS